MESPQSPSFGGRLARLPFEVQVRLSGRSWWECQFVGGQTLGEWQTAGARRVLELPLAHLSSRSRWEDVDHSRVVAARLWCPNGQIAEVRATGPSRVIQFKVGSAIQGLGHRREAHVLGVLVGDEGGCDCWEWLERGELRRFASTIFTLHERYGVGPLSTEALGLRL